MFVRLYDLAADPGEKVDLRRKSAEAFAQIKRLYDEWNGRMLPRLPV